MPVRGGYFDYRKTFLRRHIQEERSRTDAEAIRGYHHLLPATNSAPQATPFLASIWDGDEPFDLPIGSPLSTLGQWIDGTGSPVLLLCAQSHVARELGCREAFFRCLSALEAGCGTAAPANNTMAPIIPCILRLEPEVRAIKDILGASDFEKALEKANSSIVLHMLAAAIGEPNNELVRQLETMFQHKLVTPLLFIFDCTSSKSMHCRVVAHALTSFLQTYGKQGHRCLVTHWATDMSDQVINEFVAAKTFRICGIESIGSESASELLKRYRAYRKSACDDESWIGLLLYELIARAGPQETPYAPAAFHKHLGKRCVEFVDEMRGSKTGGDDLAQALWKTCRPLGVFGEVVLSEYLTHWKTYFAVEQDKKKWTHKTEASGESFKKDWQAIREHERQDGRPKFLFSEATAIAILDAIRLHEITGDNKFLPRAEACAAWLIEAAKDPCGGILTRYYFDRDKEDESNIAETSFAGRNVYAFDTAICIQAFCALFRATGKSAYRDPAAELAEFIMKKASNSEGWVYAVYDGQAEEALEDSPERWSRRFGPHHAKVAEALIDLAETLDFERENPKFVHQQAKDDRNRVEVDANELRQRAIAICSLLLKCQVSGKNASPRFGAFETSPRRIQLHPHCYAAEGLYRVGRALIRHTSMLRKRKRAQKMGRSFVTAATNAVRWALEECKKKVRMPQSIWLDSDQPSPEFRTDSLAQLLSLSVRLMHTGDLEPAYWPIADKLAAEILDLRKEDGKFQYGHYEEQLNGGTEANTDSYWTQAFCLKALWEHRLATILQDAVVIILAGGAGTRFWPLGCEKQPKPVSKAIFGDHSLLQETVRRFTHGDMFSPKSIYVLCSQNAEADVKQQLQEECIPLHNLIVEEAPSDTLTAAKQAIDKLKESQEQQWHSKNRLVVLSAADDLFRPTESFQAALAAALLAAWEGQCLAAVAKPVPPTERLQRKYGYFRYSNSDRVSLYRVYNTNTFAPKGEQEAVPEREQDPETPDAPTWACDCFTFVCPDSWFDQSWNQSDSSLANHVLAKVGHAGGPEVKVALLDENAVFGDLGEFGPDWRKMFPMDAGGNVILGRQRKGVKLLQCRNNLIIADGLEMVELYGLEDSLIVDSQSTNTTLVMPLEDGHRAGEICGGHRFSPRTRAYATGDLSGAVPIALPKCTNVCSTHGFLDCIYAGDVRASRDNGALRIAHRSQPEIECVNGFFRPDFQTLIKKEREDLELVDHLFYVTRIAQTFHDRFGLSNEGRKLGTLLCLWHDFGGFLNPELEKDEQKVKDEFREISKCQIHHTDYRVILALMEKGCGLHSSEGSGRTEKLNDSVNSAVLFVRERSIDPEYHWLRDIVLRILQVQNVVELYLQAKDWLVDTAHGGGLCGHGVSRRDGDPACRMCADQIDLAFGVLKVADIIVNGRWHWKRTREAARDRTDFREDWPQILAFIADELTRAGIAPTVYINSINEKLLGTAVHYDFGALVQKMETPRDDPSEKAPGELLTDTLYRFLLEKRIRDISRAFGEGRWAEYEPMEMVKLLELPKRLERIKDVGVKYCSTTKDELINRIEEVINSHNAQLANDLPEALRQYRS